MRSVSFPAVAYYNGSEVPLWYTDDLSNASAGNAYQIAARAEANWRPSAKPVSLWKPTGVTDFRTAAIRG